MWRPLFFLLSALACAAGPHVEVRSNEVWIVRDGRAQQVTSDGRAKLQAVLSPSTNRIAYYEQCPQSEDCLTSVVILDLEGRRLKAFHVMAGALSAPIACASILEIWWLSEASIASECHINPSLNEYLETDLVTGKTIKDLLGYGFTASPNRKYVAHVGRLYISLLRLTKAITFTSIRSLCIRFRKG